ARASARAAVLVAGSLFLAGETCAELGQSALFEPGRGGGVEWKRTAAMTARPGARGGVVAVLGAVLFGCRLACAEAMPAEVRVVSTPPPQPTTNVTVRARPDTVVEDRTVGAKPSTAGQGPVSTGETFQDEITLFLRGLETSKPAAVEVADPLVSTVRVLPAATGTTVV